MLRSGAQKAILRSLQASAAQPLRFQLNAPTGKQWGSRLCTWVTPRPLAAHNCIVNSSTILSRRSSSSTPYNKVDKEAEAELAKKKIEPHPERVSTTSSIHPVFSEVNTREPEQETDMTANIKADLQTVKETFSMTEVPHQAYVIGLAGVLPYLATSLSTVLCAWEINHSQLGEYGTIISPQTAHELLAILEPLQVGYGAVILSFLGAIHWGLEWAGYGGYHGYRRYAIGVAAPAIAWPTTILPVEYALITQFFAFNFLYYTDARATVRGWTPQWYGTYRFVLTFIVGASIVVSLIGRGQIVDKSGKLPGPVDRVQELRENAEEELAKAEGARLISQEPSGGNDEENDGNAEEEE